MIRDLQRHTWNRTASSYADVYQGQVTQTFDALLDAARVEAGIRVLDVATGPGILAAAAAERGASPVGMDIADEMIEKAKRRFPKIGFEVADAANLPFPEESFDAATISMEGHMTDVGLDNVSVLSLPIAWELDDAAYLLDAFSPMLDLDSLTASDLQSIREDIRAAAAPYERDGKYHIPFPALVVSGRK